MKLSELKDIIEKDLYELGDLEVFIMHKNPLEGAKLESVRESIRVKLSREEKKPFICFALSSCVAVPNTEATKDEVKEMFSNCTTTY